MAAVEPMFAFPFHLVFPSVCSTFSVYLLPGFISHTPVLRGFWPRTFL